MKTKLLCTAKKVLLILGILITGMNNAFAQPANDYCGNAISLTPYGGTCGSAVTGDVAGATQSMTPILCGGATSVTANDVWYKFVATSTSHIITTVGSANFDAVVELLAGACGSNISCADATLSGGTEVITAGSLVVGNTYYIRVFHYGSGAPATTTFTICITTPPPANDACLAAVPLTVYGNTCGAAVTGNVAGATQQIAPAPCSGLAANDVWYSFVALSTSQNITVVGSVNFDAVVNLRSGSCTGTSVSCMDNSGNGGTEVINATGLTVGSTYFVRVYHYWNTIPSTTTFTICITTPPPANDDCSGAVALTVYGPVCGGAVTGNVAGATLSLAATCAGTADDDVWYKFVATAAVHNITVVGSASFDAVVDLRSGACNGSNISCADVTASGGTEVINATGLVVGNTYYVRVYHWSASAPSTTTFTICVTTPAPANDECSAAALLTVYGTTCGGTVTGNVAGATQSLAGTCPGTAAGDIWYKFVASASSHIITVAGSASFDAVVDLRSGICPGTNINCADNTGSGGTETITATGLIAGNTYYVRVYHFFSAVPATTTFTICITTPAPINDNCTGATPLTVYGAACGGATTGNVAGATQSLAATCQGIANDDVWYSFVAAAASQTITVVGSASFDAVIDLRSGACNGTNISCKDTSANGGTEILKATGLTIGSTYFIRVYDYTSGVPATTTFTICVTTPTPPAPPNDNCSGAISLTVYGAICGGATTGTVTGATQSAAPISCGNFTSPAANDVWYSFVAASTSHIITVVGSASFDAVVDLRSGSCSGTNINCADGSGSAGTEVITATGLTIGSTYFVRIYSYGSTITSTPSFTICITTPAPANDNCSGAVPLTVFGSSCGGATTGNVLSATQSLPASCGGTADDDVWYSFIATGTSHDITVVGSASFDAVVDLRSGACNGTNISCIDATLSGGTEVINATGLTIGSTYFVRVYHYSASVPATTTFTICITTPVPPTPPNDNCSGAVSLTVYGAVCGGATTGNVTGATQSVAPISCGNFTSSAANDVWYSFTAASSTQIITVVGAASFDAVVDLRSGSCSGTNINCADGSGTAGTEIITATGLTPGSIYFVRVYHFGSTIPSTPTFTICITTPAPANDDCSGAVALTVYGTTCGGATTGNVAGATQSLPATCSGNANDDIWYSFVAAAASQDITVVGSASFDAVVDLRSGACNGTNISCKDLTLAGGTEVLNATGLTIGSTYYVRVYHYGGPTPATTTFTICVTTPLPPPPANDNCSGAVSLTVYGATCGGAVTGNVTGATQSEAPISCGSFTSPAANDVWYSFVAAAAAQTITVVGSVSFDAVADLRSGACPGTNVNCSDATTSGGTEVINAVGLTVGNTYFVRVYSYGSTIPATATFTICVTTPPPANDDCIGAVSLTVYGTSCGGATTGDVAGATQSLAATCQGIANDDVWYSFVATSASHIITVVGSASFDAVVDLRSGACNGTNISCSDVSGNGGTEALTAAGLTIGNTYYVRVYHYSAAVAATTTFTICITTPAPPPPANDDCTGAAPLVVYGASCGGAVTGNVASATASSTSAILCNGLTGSAEDDVWYSFVATATTHDITVVGSANFNAVVDLRSGACPGTNSSCADATGLGGTEVIHATGLTIGLTYFVRVYDFGASVPSTTTFTICITTPTTTPPPNNNCSGAISLTVYGPTCGAAVTGDVAGATQSITAITCNGLTGNANDDVWYTFVATAASHDITVQGSSSFNAVVDLHSLTCSGANIACADATGNGGTEVIHAAGLTIGTLYYVRVYDFASTVPLTTTFTICVTTPAPTPPANDNCSGAVALTVYGAACGGATTGNVAYATQSIAAITCNGLTGTANDDVWYSFVATAAAHDITVVGSTSLNAVVDVRSGSCPGTNIYCADATLAGGTEVVHAVGLTIGNTYFVRVYDFGSSVPATTAFTICVTTPSSSAPPNDNCSGATPLTVFGAACGGATTGNVAGATQSIPAITCSSYSGTANDDVWYSFVATAASHTITVVGSASFDAVIDLRSGACNGANINCADTSVTGQTEILNANGLTVGNTYFVRVYDYGSGIPATTTFTICITTPAPPVPVNDNCSGAATLTVYGPACGGATTGNVAGATQSIAAITCNGLTGTADDDVWYKFVATAAAHDITVIGSTNLNAVVDVRSGACPGTNIYCADATLAGGTEVVHAVGLTIGNTYFVRVYDFGNTAPLTTVFTICVTTPTTSAPPNDNCSGATSLTVYGVSCGGATTGDVAGATQSLPAITCNSYTGTANDDVWYSFTATSASHIITVVGSASFDAVVDLRSGACNGANIDCADTSVTGGTEILNANGLTVGNTYFVRVYHYGSNIPATTTFTICVTTPTPPVPVNDNCSGATPLTVYGASCGGATTGNVASATQSIPAITCNGLTGTADDDVWYSFVATAAAHDITVVGSTNLNAVVDVRSGSCTGTNIFCADATLAGGTEVVNAVGLTIGNTYFVRVYDFGNTVPSTTVFTICVTTPISSNPPNDFCGSAASLTVYGAACGGATTGSVSGATQSAPPITCNGLTGAAANDVWYSFVATAVSHTITVAGSTNFDAVIDLRTSGCSGTNIDCSNTTLAGGTEIVNAAGLTIGTTYFVRVYSFDTIPATSTFTICITTPSSNTPINDDCSGATSLTVYGATCGGATTGDVAGATQSIPAITCGGSTGTADDDVWYSFVATAAAHDITVVGSASFDAVIDLRSGSCSGTNINCADGTFTGGTEVLNAAGLTIGATYFVRVYDYNSTVPATTTFTICVTTPGPPPAPPVNDDCSGAVSLTVFGSTCGGTTTGDVAGATQSIPASCGGTANDDVWYSFVATAVTHNITVMGSASFDAVVDLRSGACPGTNVNCSDTSGVGGTEIIHATGLTVGSTYFVRVYHYSASVPATTMFYICITTPCLAPNTTINPAAATICTGGSTTLTANGANSYTWVPTTGLNSSTSAAVTANPASTTTYTVTGTYGGCSGTQVVTVTVDPAATAQITQIENLLTSSPGTTYQWYLNGILIPGATSQSYLATQNGNYTVMTTNASGCSATSNPFPIISFLGIDNIDGTNVISIYPNPFSTSATLEIKGAVGNDEVGFLIFDMLGREVKNVTLLPTNTTKSGMSFTIDRNDLSNGMYFYKLKNKNEIIGSGKFSIQ